MTSNQLIDARPLSELEADLVAMYRLLTEEDREFLFELIHCKYTRLVASGGTNIHLMNVFRHEQAAKGNGLNLMQHGT